MRPRNQADFLLARRHPRIKQVFEALLVEIANHAYVSFVTEHKADGNCFAKVKGLYPRNQKSHHGAARKQFNVALSRTPNLKS